MCQLIAPTKLHIDAVVEIGLIDVNTDGMWECECGGGWDCECESYDLEGVDMDELLREQAADFLKADFDEALLAELLARSEAISNASDSEAEALRHEAHTFIWNRVEELRAVAEVARRERDAARAQLQQAQYEARREREREKRQKYLDDKAAEARFARAEIDRLAPIAAQEHPTPANRTIRFKKTVTHVVIDRLVAHLNAIIDDVRAGRLQFAELESYAIEDASIYVTMPSAQIRICARKGQEDRPDLHVRPDHCAWFELRNYAFAPDTRLSFSAPDLNTCGAYIIEMAQLWLNIIEGPQDKNPEGSVISFRLAALKFDLHVDGVEIYGKPRAYH